MLVAAKLTLREIPLWLLWAGALASLAFFCAVLFRMMPPPLRRSGPGRSVLLAAGIFVVWAALSRNDGATLWFGATGFVLVALPLLWMGRLPEDMPSARDPRAREHPLYHQVERRGRLAGLAIAVLVVVDIVLSVAFVGGV